MGKRVIGKKMKRSQIANGQEYYDIAGPGGMLRGVDN